MNYAVAESVGNHFDDEEDFLPGAFVGKEKFAESDFGTWDGLTFPEVELSLDFGTVCRFLLRGESHHGQLG